ncbi:integrase catalytic domain-containing protein [Nephila pilipes]|uniref:Integrase catalytic domain-containing protein n=1 Tax=Nephila pilipes TaxID=299642 RepID=A0A8X6MG19_NEPPI|nr:integrase catalytic domain-containing protein [Nephila pilipes]
MLGAKELKEAEIKVLFIVQKSSFSSSNDEKLRNIPYMLDKNGLLRMKTRLTFREDTEDFKFPVILPSDHPVVTKSISLQKRFLYRAKLREDLRKRFRLEYLGHLRQNTKTIRRSHGVIVGEVVLVENKNLKRLCWPLGKITETFPGKDGIVRLAKVRTARCEILRPIQCLYSLEINTVSGDSLRQKVCRQTGTSAQAKKMDQTSRMTQPIQTTRRGRKVKAVQRLNL